MQEKTKRPEKKSPSESQAAIELILRSLVPEEGLSQADHIPASALIPVMARELVLVGGIREQSKPTKVAVKRISHSLQKAIAGIEALPFDFYKHTSADRKRFGKLVTGARLLNILIASAELGNQKGRNPELRKAAVAASYKTIYREITGKAGTVPVKDHKAYGPYMTSLSKIFGALNLSEQAENMSRKTRTRTRTPQKIAQISEQ